MVRFVRWPPIEVRIYASFASINKGRTLSIQLLVAPELVAESLGSVGENSACMSFMLVNHCIFEHGSEAARGDGVLNETLRRHVAIMKPYGRPFIERRRTRREAKMESTVLECVR